METKQETTFAGEQARVQRILDRFLAALRDHDETCPHCRAYEAEREERAVNHR